MLLEDLRIKAGKVRDINKDHSTGFEDPVCFAKDLRWRMNMLQDMIHRHCIKKVRLITGTHQFATEHFHSSFSCNFCCLRIDLDPVRIPPVSAHPPYHFPIVTAHIENPTVAYKGDDNANSISEKCSKESSD